MPIPPYTKLSKYVLKVLKNRGGTSSVAQTEEDVADMLGMSAKERNEVRLGKTTRVLSYRISWARYYLKQNGFLEPSKRGIITLSEKGKNEIIII